MFYFQYNVVVQKIHRSSSLKMTESRKRTREWLRCGEGFSELTKAATTTKNGQKKSAVRRKSCQSTFPAERNIFDNLFGEIKDGEKECSKYMYFGAS